MGAWNIAAIKFTFLRQGNHQDMTSTPLGNVNTDTVRSYSERGASAYEDPMNKNFLYGDITVRFLQQVSFHPVEKVILDLGAGTGFVFDELHHQFEQRNLTGIAVEPALGMLDLAREKYRDHPRYSFLHGSFEAIPLPDRSVDKILSTLALHWVKSLEVAATEMRRVLRDHGSLEIFMIAKDDGAEFKKGIVEALKIHLNFGQIMKTAALVQRVTPDQVVTAFAPFRDQFEIQVEEHRDVVYGSFDEHMKWWTARSTPVIAEVENKPQFMLDLREAMEKRSTDRGIPFDTAYLWIKAWSKTR